jgi:hypothetical protein
LFRGSRAEVDGARRASEVIQIPVYAGLKQEQVERIAGTVGRVVAGSDYCAAIAARRPRNTNF